MVVISVPMVTVCNPVQPWNPVPKFVTESGMVMVVIPVLSLNTSSAMVVTPLGIVIDAESGIPVNVVPSSLITYPFASVVSALELVLIITQTESIIETAISSHPIFVPLFILHPL